MKKRIVAMLLAACMACSLAGCGEKKEEPAQTPAASAPQQEVVQPKPAPQPEPAPEPEPEPLPEPEPVPSGINPRGIPYAIIVDANGKVLSKGHGHIALQWKEVCKPAQK